jgi:hypothetical protein
MHFHVPRMRFAPVPRIAPKQLLAELRDERLRSTKRVSVASSLMSSSNMLWNMSRRDQQANSALPGFGVSTLLDYQDPVGGNPRLTFGRRSASTERRASVQHVGDLARAARRLLRRKGGRGEDLAWHKSGDLVDSANGQSPGRLRLSGLVNDPPALLRQNIE